MKTVVIKVGASGNLTLGNAAMPAGWTDKSKRVAHLHIEGVPDSAGPADVLIKLRATVPLVLSQPDAKDIDFVIPWDDLGAAKIVRSRQSNDLSDWIQDAVIERAKALNMTAYAIAKASNGAVSEDHVRAYLTREKSMGSHKLQHVLRILGLKITH